ncbi:MAG: beta-ketoacyl-ACP synthase III [Actinomycetota bacterium]|nr:beta-ketoacyl-ACP synthase III [Actinomycetota bacterium]
MAADIVGIGVSIPEKVLTNADLEKMVDTSDEWIVTRTGIRERRIIDDEETVSDLAAAAGLAAIEDADIGRNEIDLVLVATGSPETIWPSTACLAQGKMGLPRCAAFDLQAACTGFVYGLAVADSLIASGLFKTVLLIGAEAMSRFVDWSDRNTCILFGDGAGAVVLREARPGYGVLASYLDADGRGADLLKIPVGEKHQTIKMSGNEIFRFAVKILPQCVESALKKAGLGIENVDYFIPHQANQRIIEAALDRLGLPKERAIGNIAQYGNTSTASIPLALDEIYRTKSLKQGDIIVTAAFGAGLTWGANVIKWSGTSGGMDA